MRQLRVSSEVGALLRQLRVAAGLTQEELAERAGLGVRTIQGFEGDERQPRRDTVRRLADALGLTAPDRARLEAAARVGPRQNLVVLPSVRPAEWARQVDSGGGPPHNLPAPLASFVGREGELAEVRRLLATTRLLTLTGAGGVGKSTLALHLARAVLDSYPDGTWLVELAPLANPDLIPSAIATALSIRDEAGRSTLVTLVDALRSRRLVLVLDNCEHLVASCAELARALLQQCPDLTILATSRERLGTPGEVTWRVPSLPTASVDDPPPFEKLLDYPAVRLFVERARAVEPRFALTLQNASAVTHICARLDGIPLAIEIVAARVRVLTAEQIAPRLDDRLALLIGIDRVGTPRHRTLRAAIEWSHDLLAEDERALFRRLSVFAGSFDLEGVLGVGCCPGSQGSNAPFDALDLLTSLIDKSLVVVEEAAGQARYRFLETIRQYAWERLEQAQEAHLLRRQHLQFYLSLAERAELGVWSEAQTEWLTHLEREHDNIRAALRESLETDPEAGLRLASGLWRFWCDRGHHWEARAWYERLLAATSEEAPARGRALYALGMVAYSQADYAAAWSAYERCVPILRASGDQRRLAHALEQLGDAARNEGDHVRARAALEEGVAIARDLLSHLPPNAPLDTGRPNIGLAYLGDLELAEGRAERAERLWVESLTLCRQSGDRRGWCYVLRRLGALARDRGDLDRAKELLDEALALAWTNGHGPGVGGGLEEHGAWAIARGNPIKAVRLLAASEQAFAKTRRPGATSPRLQAQLLRAREQIGDGAVDRAWAEGRAMTLEQAVAYALEAERA